MIRFSIFFLLGFSLPFFSCDSDNQDIDLSGNWKLTQILSDPGDGSGEFLDTNSNFSYTIAADSSFVSDNIFCVGEMGSTGQFSKDNKVVYDGCLINVPYPTYTLESDNILIIKLSCIEPCAQKYERQ